jgi:hypothetical protein
MRGARPQEKQQWRQQKEEEAMRASVLDADTAAQFSTAAAQELRKAGARARPHAARGFLRFSSTLFHIFITISTVIHCHYHYVLCDQYH